MNAPAIANGTRVRFSPNPRQKDRVIEGVVVRHRWDVGNGQHHGWRRSGWLDVRGDDGFERSVRPSLCEVVE